MELGFDLGAVEAVVLRFVELGIAPSHPVADALEVLVFRAKGETRYDNGR